MENLLKKYVWLTATGFSIFGAENLKVEIRAKSWDLDCEERFLQRYLRNWVKLKQDIFTRLFHFLFCICGTHSISDFTPSHDMSNLGFRAP